MGTYRCRYNESNLATLNRCQVDPLTLLVTCGLHQEAMFSKWIERQVPIYVTSEAYRQNYWGFFGLS
jgi:hypothetical protein